ncbi:MAG: hypothetical protein QM535_21155 [Limnohabitans sp.]|nr:hypothetical protein [Limnohabitans sp.]
MKTEFLVHHRETFFTTQIDIKFRNKKGEIIIANYKTSSDIFEEQHIQGCLEYVAYLDTFEKDIAKHQILCFYKEDVFDKSPTLRFLKINETGEDGEQFHYAGELAVVDTELALIPVALGKASITKIRKQNPVDINTDK